MMFRTNFRFHNIVDTDYFGFNNPALGTYFWNESSSFAFDDVHSFTPTFVMDIKAERQPLCPGAGLPDAQRV